MTTRTRERRAKQAARRGAIPAGAVAFRNVTHPGPITAEQYLKMGGEITPALTVAGLKTELANLPDDAVIYIYDHATQWTHHPELLAPIIFVTGPYDDNRVTLHQGPPEENEPAS
jgi:hypothetical protein